VHYASHSAFYPPDDSDFLIWWCTKDVELRTLSCTLAIAVEKNEIQLFTTHSAVPYSGKDKNIGVLSPQMFWLGMLYVLRHFVSKYRVIQKDGLCLYTDSLFAEIGDSNDECCSSLEVEC